jgi:hypothetical protein
MVSGMFNEIQSPNRTSGTSGANPGWICEVGSGVEETRRRISVRLFLCCHSTVNRFKIVKTEVAKDAIL